MASRARFYTATAGKHSFVERPLPGISSRMWLTIGIERSLGSINASAERETKGCGVASVFNLPRLELSLNSQFHFPGGLAIVAA